LRDYAEQARAEILTVRNAAEVQLVGAKDQKIYREFDTKKPDGLGVSRYAIIINSLREQNAVMPSGVVQTCNEKFAVLVSGAFRSADDFNNINLFANGKFFRLADLAEIEAAYADPPQPMFRY
jgi:multidrug efflux pump subunit AcrB